MDKFIIFTVVFVSAHSVKQYRLDYIYNSRALAFYKFHTEYEYSWRAQQKCETEGAKLMIPSSDVDIIQAHGMMKQFPDIEDRAWIGEDGQQHESAEVINIIDLVNPTTESWNPQTCEVMLRSGEVETMRCNRQLPFICKVDLKDAPYDPHCDVYSKDYVYYENVGSCYKIPQVVYAWNQAYHECSAENAHLVVINSELEHLVVQSITNAAQRLLGATTTWFFFAGFRAEQTANATRVFKTIFGQTLEEAGYAQWSPNEPNNAKGEDCGSIFKNDGKFNDLDCTHLYGFVCEKEVLNKH